MNRLSRQLTRRCCLLSLILILFLSPAAADQSATRVLIQPLAIHADKDLTFLNKGILEMMASRIGRSATVIRDDNPSSSKDAVQQARNRKADYVVVGSLTLFGNTVSTDAALIKTGTEEVVLQFSRLGQESSAVLTDIDAFSTQVADYLATGAVETPSLAAPTTPAPPVLLPLPPPAVPPTETAIPALTTPPPVTDLPAKTASIWRSRAFKGQIGALTTGAVSIVNNKLRPAGAVCRAVLPVRGPVSSRRGGLPICGCRAGRAAARCSRSESHTSDPSRHA